VAGCLVRGGDGLVSTPRREPILELDSLPFPAWDLIDMPAYWNYPRLGVIAAQREYMLMLTSRGCPFDCAYCHHNMGRLYRPRGAENVVEEIELLRRDHGVGEIVIADDSFNLIRERVHRICELILQRGLKVALTFPTGIRGDLLDDETLQLLRRAGTYRIMFAVETATPRLQKLINKNVDFPKLERAMHTARRLGMLLHGAVMLGLPTETEQEMRDTIRYIRRSPLHTIGLYRATPYKGCELYETARRMGLVLPEKQHTMSLWESGVNLSAAPLQTVNRLSRRAYFQFYGNPARMLGLLWRLPNKRSMLPLLARLFFKNIRGYRSRAAA